MMLLEDLGGFSAAALKIPSIFMGFYSGKMYQAAVLEGTPIKEKSKRNKAKNKVQEKFKGEKPCG